MTGQTYVKTDGIWKPAFPQSGERGVFGSGNANKNHYTDPVYTIDYITISTPSNAQDFGDLTVTRYNLVATSNGSL